MKRSIRFLLVSSLVAIISIGCSDNGYNPTDNGHDNSELSYVWTRIATPTTNKLHAVAFADTLVGICVGDNTTILRTLNGGRTWEELSITEDINLKDIVCIDREHFQAVGTSFSESFRIQTGNGGDAWGVTIYPNEQYPDWSLMALSCSDYTHGVMVGLNGLVATFQSGTNHIESGTISNLYDVSYATGVRYYAVGLNGVILQTVDGGQSWVIDPTGVNNGLIGIDMLPVNVGFAVGSEGVVLRGDLNGWEPRPTRTNNSLIGVSFRDEFSGIVVGAFGTVLRTDDGGESWKAEECETDLTLRNVFYDQSGFGIAVGDSGSVYKRFKVSE